MKNTTKSAIFALITVLVWSSAFPITKYASSAFSPNVLGLLRCGVASVILLVIGFFNRIKAPKKLLHLPLFFLCGAFGFGLYMIFFNSGMLTMSSAGSSLIIATAPVLTAIGAFLFYREGIKPLGWCAIATAFLGVSILFVSDIAKGGLGGASGILWIMAAAIVFCCYNLMTRKLLSLGYTAMECVTWSMVCGTVLLLPFLPEAIGQIGDASASAILATLYLGAMPSAISHLFWNAAMALALRTSDVANYQFLTPLFSTVMGFAILGEVPGPLTVLGGLIILVSIVVFARGGKQAKR